MLERNKKPLYYCRRLKEGDAGYIDNGTEQFAAPILRYLNFKSLSGEVTLETVGEVNSKNLVGKLLSGGDTYTEMDRCYVDVKPPDPYDPLCSDADYHIVSVLPINRTIEIVLGRGVG
ncbi:MAG TPA: hypothetical protein VHO94_04075 [Oscillospiraceae bacterium]|nr:hypothetical protein [Oscillospiraceae bacterium]